MRVRPQFEAALAQARDVKTHAPHCRVVLTVNEIKRLGGQRFPAAGHRPGPIRRLACRPCARVSLAELAASRSQVVTPVTEVADMVT